MATPPPPFQTSHFTRQGRDFDSAVLTDLARDSTEAAMYMRSTLGFQVGTLAGPSLVSLLLKLRRSTRGAGVTRQRAPGRPGGPGNMPQAAEADADIVWYTYTCHIPVTVIYHWSVKVALCALEHAICLGRVSGMSGLKRERASCSSVFLTVQLEKRHSIYLEGCAIWYRIWFHVIMILPMISYALSCIWYHRIMIS
jgi:hypothetical protein